RRGGTSATPVAKLSYHPLAAARQLYDPPGGPVAPAARIDRVEAEQGGEVQRRRAADAEDVDLLVRERPADVQQAGEDVPVGHGLGLAEQVGDEGARGDGLLAGELIVRENARGVLLEVPADMDDGDVPVVLVGAVDLHRPVEAGPLLLPRHA